MLPAPTCTTTPFINIPHQGGTNITTDESPQTHLHHSKSIGTLWFTLGTGFGKNVWWHVYAIITSCSFTASKSFVLYLVIPPSPQTLPTWSFSVFTVLHFLKRMSCSWNHTICCLSDWLLSVSNKHLSFSHVFSWLESLFSFSALNSTPLSGCTTVYSFTLGRTSWLLPKFGNYE